MSPTFIQNMARKYGTTIHDADPSPEASANAREQLKQDERERTLEVLLEECVRHRWIRGNPRTIERAAELGISELLPRVPATLDELDVPRRGQVRFERHHEFAVWHALIWVSERTAHKPICGKRNLVPFPKHARGQSQRPTGSEYDRVCVLCSRRLAAMVESGGLSGQANPELFEHRRAAASMARYSPI